MNNVTKTLISWWNCLLVWWNWLQR